MPKGDRTVSLLAGEALFEVAHDSTRPFTVRAGDARVIATCEARAAERKQEK